MPPGVKVKLSGERFRVLFRLVGTEPQARQMAREICYEQTVELPDDLVPGGDIRDHILGRVESFQPSEKDHWETVISFAAEVGGSELTQLLNVIFGNISLTPGIRVERIELSPAVLNALKGPRFGREGLRAVLGVPQRPLLCTALKPMGLPSPDLASLAYQFALGGIDIVKDDHGLADQPFAPFEERVQRCAEAVTRANRETGFRCIYMPNVTGRVDRIVSRSIFAKKAGAGGIMVSPGLVGFDVMRDLSTRDAVGLPIMAHPSFLGSLVSDRNSGISHYALFGQLTRLSGADATIFPN